jgi:hypothetical protein
MATETTEPTAPETHINRTGFTGAAVTAGRTERSVRFYAFNDSDLDNIGNLSFDQNALLAIAGVFGGVAVTSVAECMLTPDPTRLRVFHMLLGVAIAIVVVCVAGVWRIASKRGSIIRKIKADSRDIS